MGAPYWDAYAHGTICGITRGTKAAHIARAALEGIAFQTMDIVRAMEKDGLKTAILVSSLTFGLGHIVNLFNESGRDFASSFIQIIFAVLVGLVLVLIFHRGGSLIPCIVFHSVNNALSAFEVEGTMGPKENMLLNILLIIVVLGGYALYLVFGMKKTDPSMTK